MHTDYAFEFEPFFSIDDGFVSEFRRLSIVQNLLLRDYVGDAFFCSSYKVVFIIF